LAQTLVGAGVAVLNATINCPANAYGTFSNGGTTNIGLNNGIILTTGSAINAIGPNNAVNAATDNAAPGDPDLTALTTTTTHDACNLQFDIILPAIRLNSIMFSDLRNILNTLAPCTMMYLLS